MVLEHSQCYTIITTLHFQNFFVIRRAELFKLSLTSNLWKEQLYGGQEHKFFQRSNLSSAIDELWDLRELIRA